jgi:hypothetical protein
MGFRFRCVLLSTVILAASGCGIAHYEQVARFGGGDAPAAEVGLARDRPDPALTPGAICTQQDPHFQGYDYPDHVARCRRALSESGKQKVAASYGNVPRHKWKDYEFDHLIPLCAGGSNDLRNIWMQPIDEALDKDELERRICTGLRSGTMNQREALGEVDVWINRKQAKATSQTYEQVDQ